MSGKGVHTLHHTVTNTSVLIVTPNISRYLKSKHMSRSDFEMIGGASKLSGRLANNDYRREIYIVFRSIKVNRPTGKLKYPYQYRNTHSSYMAPIQVEIAIKVVEYVGNRMRSYIYSPKEPKDKIYANVGNFPIMTGSKLDNLVLIKPKTRWVAYGENPLDPLSQLIIGGNYYTLFLRESMRPNRIFNYFIKKNKKEIKISSFTSSSPRYTRYVKLVTDKFGEIGIVIYSTKDIKKTKVEGMREDILNVFTFCRFMFGVTQKEILSYIRSFSNRNTYQKIYNYLRITLEKDNTNPDPLMHISELMGTPVSKKDGERLFYSEKYKNTFNKDTYPHVDGNFKNKVDILAHKFTLLMLQTARYVEYLTLIRPADDKNSW